MLTPNSKVRLGDGRWLSYSSTGPPGGFPILYFHGAIGSPVSHLPELRSTIDRLGIRYVVVNRPGFGESDPNPGRVVAGFADDVRELADALGLRRLSIVGVSTGAPYALACTLSMPERLVGVAAVSSQAPGSAPHATPGTALHYRLGLGLLSRAPRSAARGGEACTRVLRSHPSVLARIMRAGAGEADRAALPEELGDPVARTLVALTAGPAPMIEDYLVCCRAWGFDLAQVTAPVRLWHGELDPLVPLRHAQRLAALLPACTLEVEPRAGHFFFRRRLTEVLAPLVPAPSRGPQAT